MVHICWRSQLLIKTSWAYLQQSDWNPFYQKADVFHQSRKGHNFSQHISVDRQDLETYEPNGWLFFFFLHGCFQMHLNQNPLLINALSSIFMSLMSCEWFLRSELGAQISATILEPKLKIKETQSERDWQRALHAPVARKPEASKDRTSLRGISF